MSLNPMYTEQGFTGTKYLCY